MDDGDFAIVILPDTQLYARDYPEIFSAQAQWIADNRTTLNIQLVLHEGDVVHNGGYSASEWTAASNAWDLIDAANIPYVIAAGNHDYEGGGIPTPDRDLTTWNANVGLSRYTGAAWWNGGFYEADKGENSYLLLTIESVDYIILNLEFGPRQAVLDWANGILTTYSSRTAIVLTHSYMYGDNTRTGSGDDNNPKSYNLGADVHDGEDMWTELVKLHGSIILVQSGHHISPDGIGRRVDTGDEGNTINQVLVNYQAITNGGNGFLRVAIVKPSTREILMRTYSPPLDQLDNSPEQSFDLEY